jgi:hypothetical protein
MYVFSYGVRYALYTLNPFRYYWLVYVLVYARQDGKSSDVTWYIFLIMY